MVIVLKNALAILDLLPQKVQKELLINFLIFMIPKDKAFFLQTMFNKLWLTYIEFKINNFFLQDKILMNICLF